MNNLKETVNSGYAFEGMIARAALTSTIPYEVTSRHMFTNHDPDCLDPNTKTIHMHNIMNLKNTLLHYGITSGKHIKNILDNNETIQAWDGEVLSREINRVLRGPNEE